MALPALPPRHDGRTLSMAVIEDVRLLAADRDPQAEAANALALATGLGDSVMTNMRTPETALGLLHYHLDHLFRTL